MWKFALLDCDKGLRGGDFHSLGWYRTAYPGITGVFGWGVSLSPRLRGPGGPRQLIGKPCRVIDSRYVTNSRPDRRAWLAQLLGRLGDWSVFRAGVARPRKEKGWTGGRMCDREILRAIAANISARSVPSNRQLLFNQKNLGDTVNTVDTAILSLWYQIKIMMLEPYQNQQLYFFK